MRTGVAHGRSIPLRPMLEMFRQRFGITEQDNDLAAREKIAGALLLLDPAFAEMLPTMFDFMGVPDPTRPAPRVDPKAAFTGSMMRATDSSASWSRLCRRRAGCCS
jgi:adenylate cyclase